MPRGLCRGIDAPAKLKTTVNGTRASGTSAAGRQHANGVRILPDFDPSFNSFIDFEDATVSFKDGGLGACQSFFESLQQANLHRKWAIYSQDPVTFQSANMSHLLLSGVIEVDGFRKRSKALAFSGIAGADLAGG